MTLTLNDIVKKNFERAIKSETVIEMLLYYKRALSSIFVQWQEAKDPKAYVVFSTFYPVYSMLDNIIEEENLEDVILMSLNVEPREFILDIIKKNYDLYEAFMLKEKTNCKTLLNIVSDILDKIIALVDIKESYFV